MRGEISDYQTAKELAEGNARLRGAVRLATTVSALIYLGLGFSLRRVAPGAAEYYVSIFTLALNTLLFAGALTTSAVLKRRHERYVQMMDQLARADRPDPWRVDQKRGN